MVAAKIQAERSAPEERTSARWQKRAWAPREARQRTQLLGSRLAPQALQNFPEAEAPQAGQTAAVGGAVMWVGSVNPAAVGR